MKTTLKRTAALLLAVMMVFAMTACGGSSSGDSKKDAGKYVIYEMKSGDTTITTEMLKTLGMDTGYLELREDGTATMALTEDDKTEMTWSNGKLTAEGESIEYKLVDGLLTLQISDEQITFKKS